MGDLTSLQKSARSLILSLREGIEQLEQASSSGHSTGLANTLEKKLADLQRTSREMDNIWRMQVVRESADKRDLWKRKVELVVEEEEALSLALHKHTHRQRRRQVEDQERYELLERRGNASTSWQVGDGDTAPLQGYVQNSKRALEEAFQTGTQVLTNMAGQRERLKSAQRKMLDVLNSVGLSDSLLRVIERRQKSDNYITYGGMVLTLVLLIGLWWWLRQ
ncbi:hypothetical protein WJX72_000581 [[Myrmecia] bisecta]|uniref:Membrin n=1 Tax=[Myrmecia] bisecta TaxID=41462 RepID=A0AAW1QPI3_9CHLO